MIRSAFKVITLLTAIAGINLVQAAEVKLAIGLTLPPYIISSNNTGMELDIVKEALAHKGHTITIDYYPFARVITAMETDKADAALTTNEGSGMTGVHYSDSHITYQNVAIALKEKNLGITDVASLGNHSILAFQNATKYLGDAYAQMAKANKKYKEKPKQGVQIVMLYSKRVDAIVSDINIFKYFRKDETSLDTSAEIDVFEVFDPTNYKVAFRDSGIRDDFNQGLKAIKASGRYNEIINSYIK